MSTHRLLKKTLTILLVIFTPFTIWKALCLITASSYPFVVVISESMAPAFNRGDILFLSNWQHDISIADIPVVWFPGNPLPMVHRVIEVLVESNRYLFPL